MLWPSRDRHGARNDHQPPGNARHPRAHGPACPPGLPRDGRRHRPGARGAGAGSHSGAGARMRGRRRAAGAHARRRRGLAGVGWHRILAAAVRASRRRPPPARGLELPMAAACVDARVRLGRPPEPWRLPPRGDPGSAYRRLPPPHHRRHLRARRRHAAGVQRLRAVPGGGAPRRAPRCDPVAEAARTLATARDARGRFAAFQGPGRVAAPPACLGARVDRYRCCLPALAGFST